MGRIYTVNTLNDSLDFLLGVTSLREAVALALPGDKICFDASLAGGTIALNPVFGEMTINWDVTIDGDILGGDEAADITISGGGATQIFVVKSGTLDLDSLTLTGGSSNEGGAISVASGAGLDVFASTFSSNTAGSSGGAIFNDGGTVTIADSTFSGNAADFDGGAIYTDGGTVTIADSTFSGNAAESNGGAIYTDGGSLSLTNTTVFGNTSGDFVIGGAIHANGPGVATIVNSTITGNTGGLLGAGLGNASATMTLTNTIVSGNTENSPSGLDFFGAAFTDNGGNVIGGDASLIFGSNVLADHGGPVQTVALANDPTNPALDVGGTAAGVNGVAATDIAGAGNEGSNFGDAGAYELFCFAAGTQIATPDGETPVENLRIGDLVTTQNQRVAPVTWIGRQSVAKWRHGPHMQPVRLRAGALGGGLPLRDLTVTADHGMVLDGLIINASALVNGASIDWVPLSDLPESFTVYHVETEAHEVILANGAPSETFIDYRDRRAFDNFNEYLDLYGVERIIPEMAHPRISSRRMLPQQIRDRLEPVDASVAPDLARLA